MAVVRRTPPLHLPPAMPPGLPVLVVALTRSRVAGRSATYDKMPPPGLSEGEFNVFFQKKTQITRLRCAPSALH
jgi:hypothetical protein